MKTKTLGRTNLKVSRVGLGTAEIGFAYGLGHKIVPSDVEADRLLKSAVEMGINFFDTANIHQLADERIARSGIAKIPGVIIATKCAHFLEKGEDPEIGELEKRIRGEVETSLRNLKLDTLPILQLHGGTKEQIERGAVIEILDKIKKEGKARYVGISTRGEEASVAAIKSGFFDVIHVAYSILDQRMAKNVLPAAEHNNIGVINRSVLLKGVLSGASKILPPELAPLKENSDKARDIAEKLGISLPSLALRFVLSEEAVSTSLIGTNQIGHLKEVMDAIAAEPLSDEVIVELNKLAINDPMQIDPAKWPQIS
ncbi:MAG: aldo/keto reductase [Candidatus Yanofskybacteria bacterium]|nr:aldo/keto reductase [Candidatus Yanofskybacteria bacterium]